MRGDAPGTAEVQRQELARELARRAGIPRTSDQLTHLDDGTEWEAGV